VLKNRTRGVFRWAAPQSVRMSQKTSAGGFVRVWAWREAATTFTPGRRVRVTLYGMLPVELPPSRLNLVRGFFATIVCTLVGAIAPICIMVSLSLLRWWISGASEWDRKYDIHCLKTSLFDPVIGCATVCACAGWVTFAPPGRFRFSLSLATIFAITMPIWFIAFSLEITPRRYKGIQHPAIYLSELMVLIVPPILAAAIVTALRLRGVSQQPLRA
jgi:hypothetical protein